MEALKRLLQQSSHQAGLFALKMENLLSFLLSASVLLTIPSAPHLMHLLPFVNGENPYRCPTDE